ncbi:hypothetical protein [Streptomyces sp. NP-1717]|uniref:hypothetical protein n=1 Tax=unclassified Streptomyces TaxID=2593676 RepID=UPI001F5E121B|nr:hypothetical protein [Streptomyces sp. NP-1717]MCI3222147.1 hypothetical protein [Streptomyces sp. NP-1717]WTA73076.1 hypothetical protein OG705_09315 [Streptomyces sp. NBC_00838]
MRTERPRLALAVLALALLSGCGANDDEAPKTPKTATGSLEQLAEQAACDPNVQTDAEELRQANCRTGDGRYILTTFATDRGLREWINEANDYGGSYLVGRKWVVSGDAKVVETLRGRLGGTVETAPEHHSGGGEGGDTGGGSGESEGGEGHAGHDDMG